MSDARDAVVVPASRYPHGYASVRTLGRAGARTIVATSNPDLPVTASRYCDEVAEVPPETDLLAYRDGLLCLAARPDVRTIVPHRPQDPYLFAKYAEAFDRHVDLVVPSLDTLRYAHDRKRLFDAATDAGVPVPETRLLTEVDEWQSDQIVKSRYNLLTDEYLDSFEPGDSKIAKRVAHVRANDPPDVDAMRREMGHTPIVQEYVEGQDEYLFGALYDRGEPVATFQHRQIRADSYTGSGGAYRESVFVPELERVARSLLDRIGWHGLACIEYVRDAATGEFKPVEINPRMWQSLACATRASAAFPYWYWLRATDPTAEIDPGYETGVRTHYLSGELAYLISIAREDSALVERPSMLRSVTELLRSWCDHPKFDYLHADDVRPTLRQIRLGSASAVGRRLK